MKPLGPEIVQEGFEAGGLLTTQEKVMLVEVFLRTRVGFVEKVMMETGADTTQFPPLSTYPALHEVQEPAAPLPFGQVGAQLPPLST